MHGGARREWADARDAADDGAGEIVCVGDEGRLRVGRGAEVGGEGAGGDPQSGYGEGEDAVGDRAARIAGGLVEGDGGDGEKEGGGEEKERGGMGMKGGEKFSGGEADRGEEQRGATKAERVDAGGVGREEFGTGRGADGRGRWGCVAIAEAGAWDGLDRGCGGAGGHQARTRQWSARCDVGPGRSALQRLRLIVVAILDADIAAMENRDCFLVRGLGKHVNQMELGEVVAGG